MSLIYLHGFQSSSVSRKGTQMKQYCAEQGRGDLIELPTLPPKPALAQQWLRDRFAAGSVQGVVGSSLGGCYAHWVAAEYDVPAVLVNPATEAHRLMREYLGENENPTTGEHFVLDEQDMQTLEQMDSAPIRSPDKLLCLLEKADDVLDWSVAAKRYAHCQLRVFEGGSHTFDNWEATLPLILTHLGQSP